MTTNEPRILLREVWDKPSGQTWVECEHYIADPWDRCRICFPEIARLQAHSGDGDDD